MFVPILFSASQLISLEVACYLSNSRIFSINLLLYFLRIFLDHKFAHRQKKSARRMGTFHRRAGFATFQLALRLHRFLAWKFVMECSLRSSGCLTSAFAVSRSIFSGRQLLHLVGYVGICVQGSSAGYITQNCRQGLDVHSVGLGVGCKSMARTMKSHPFTSRIIQNSVQALMGRGWTHGQVFFLWGWKHPS